MKNTYKTRRPLGRLVLHIEGLSRYSMRILRISLPLVCFSLLALMLLLKFELENTGGAALSNYLPMIKYIINSLAIAVGGALLLDIADKKNKK